MPIRYEIWPQRPPGGQHVGTGPSGVRGVHYIGDYPSGIEASCEYHRSQHKNRNAVQEMIEWALASAGIKETDNAPFA
jgi:protein subunit release factor A